MGSSRSFKFQLLYCCLKIRLNARSYNFCQNIDDCFFGQRIQATIRSCSLGRQKSILRQFQYAETVSQNQIDRESVNKVISIFS